MGAVNAIAEEYGGIESWIEDIMGGANWEQHDLDEGRSVPIGGFDSGAARQSFSEALGAIDGVNKHVGEITQIVTSQFKSDLKYSQESIKITLVGIFLIVVGFSLQIAAVLT